MVKIIKSKGSSGVEILFYTNEGGIKAVRKKAAKVTQSDRLKIQFEKHKFLLNHKSNLFHIPEILKSGFAGELFFYEYKYIEGVNMTQSFIEKTNKQLYPLMDNLLSTIKYFSKQDNFFEVSQSNIHFKDAIYEKVINNSDYLDLKLKKKLIGTLEKLIFPTNKTLHHGDLSFDNIIVDEHDRIWLIDFIGTFYPHYWFDISKLFQDIEGGWSYIKHGVRLDPKKAKYFTDYLKNEIGLFDQEYIRNHNFLMSIIFLRILPYLKSSSKKAEILQKITNYLQNE